MDLSKLKDPFPESDIEWRIQSSGLKNGKPWGMCLAYVTNRAIMERLDDVCGPENWSNRFERWGDAGVLCGISISIEDGTDRTHKAVTKWDGAEDTAIESVKGGLSSAMKRAAVQWGIGRYLYNLEAGWAEFSENGKYRAKVEGQWFKWNPPKLPVWALPVTDRVMDVSAFHALTEERGMTEDEVNDFMNSVCNAKKNANFDELAGDVVKNFDKTYKWWMEKRLT